MTDACLSAAIWIQHLLTGQAALALATIAIAILGLTVMAGRLPIRRGIEVVTGMFLIFGAATVAGELAHTEAQQPVAYVPLLRAPPVQIALPTASAYDPYAGASVPQHRGTSDIAVPN